jgi:hypothetical protein
MLASFIYDMCDIFLKIGFICCIIIVKIMGIILGVMGCNPHILRWKQGKGRGRDGRGREMRRATPLFDTGLRYW